MNEFFKYQETNTRPVPAVPYHIYPLHVTQSGPHVPLHWHKELEIILPYASGCLETDGHSIDFVKGDILFVSPYTLHSTSMSQPGDVCHIVLQTDCISFSQDTPVFMICRQITEGEASFPTRITEGDPIYAPLYELISRIASLPSGFRNVPEDSTSIPPSAPVDTRLLQFISLYFAMLACLSENRYIYPSELRQINPSVRYVKQSIRYMYLHLDESVSVSDLARCAGLSEGHFSRIFKEFTHQSPACYLNDLKLEASCRFLADGQSVTKAAGAAGFDNISYFIRTFRRKYGLTPKAYQKNSRHNPVSQATAGPAGTPAVRPSPAP